MTSDNNGYPLFIDGEDLPPITVHKYDLDSDRCLCGGEVVYFEDIPEPGEGCEVEGKPWPSSLSSKIDLEDDDYYDEYDPDLYGEAEEEE